VNVDDISVTAPGATAAPVLPAGPLGGYIRSFDSNNGTYSGNPACSAGESNTTCQAPIPSMAQGLLNRSGWYLLDDTRTAVWTSDGWIAARPADDLEDGYLFGYGDDYTAALSDLARLSGPLIAATARVHDMTVVTRNVRDFELAGVQVLNPFTGQSGNAGQP
jgi:hypothetical protein